MEIKWAIKLPSHIYFSSNWEGLGPNFMQQNSHFCEQRRFLNQINLGAEANEVQLMLS